MQDSQRSSFFAQARPRWPNVAVTAVGAAAEASTAAAVMVVAAFTVVVGSAAATVEEVTATAAGEWARDTAVADMEGCAADTRGAALEVEEVGPRVVVPQADGPVGVETEGAFRALLTGSGIRSERPGAESRLREWVALADPLIGAEAITAGAAVSVGGAGMDIAATPGEVVGAVAGGLASVSGLAGGRDGILFGIGRRMDIVPGGTTGIRLTFIRMRTSWT